MAPELGKYVRLASFALFALSIWGVEIAAGDEHELLMSTGWGALWITLALGISWFVPAPERSQAKPPFWMFVVLLALGLLPFVVEPLRRSWTNTGHPLEMQMVLGLRNVSLGLLVFSGHLYCLRICCVVSLFLVLFAISMVQHWIVFLLLGLYTASGSVWLMLSYWSGLNTFGVTTQQAVALEVHGLKPRFSWLSPSLLTMLVVASAGLAFVGPKRVALSLGEWLPTSGGTGNVDPFARSGIGDGPEETVGDNPQSAGMVESQKVIEDNNNSLIDALSDLYGPPKKPLQEQERSVAAGKLDVVEQHGKVAQNLRPSRAFQTHRQSPKAHRHLSSIAPRGVLEIEGRTPLHIRLIAYDWYDAERHRWLEARKPKTLPIQTESNDWMRVADIPKAEEWYLTDETHRLKVAELKANLVPTPSLLTRFRIQRVDRADYYEWDYDGVLVLSGRSRTPSGVVVNTVCHTLAPEKLPSTAFAQYGAVNGAIPEHSDVPESLKLDLQAQAKAWAEDHPRGWPQIHALLRKLREEYVCDPEAVAPEDHPAPVLWFLHESKRGPDYLFASAATLLLRSLGYPSRICLGYYASPQAFDAETEHTPVRATDLHFWPEVLLHDGHWLVVEPTPGYEVLRPTLPWSERAWLQVLACWNWLRAHALGLSLGACLVGLLLYQRRAILDACFVARWRLFPGKSWREMVFGCLRILELRCRWQQRERPPAQTLTAWMSIVRQELPNEVPLTELVSLAEWAAYAPASAEPLPREAVQTLCRRALAHWPLHRKSVPVQKRMTA